MRLSLGPRGGRLAELTPGKAIGTPERNQATDSASQPSLLPTIAGLPPSAPGCDPGGHLPSQSLGKSQSRSPMKGESKNLISLLKPISPTLHTFGRDCLGQRWGGGPLCSSLCLRAIPTTQKVPLDGQSVTNTASRHLPSCPSPPTPRRGAQHHICARGAFVPRSQPVHLHAA